MSRRSNKDSSKRRTKATEEAVAKSPFFQFQLIEVRVLKARAVKRLLLKIVTNGQRKKFRKATVLGDLPMSKKGARAARIAKASQAAVEANTTDKARR